VSDRQSSFVDTLQGVARAGPVLDVQANMSVTVDGTDLAVSTVGDRLRVQVPSLAAGVRLLRAERGRLPDLSESLAAAGLTAEVRIGDAVVAVVGADAAPGFLSGLLSLGPVEVRPTEAVAAALRLR
jgi:hypothetical protein